MALKVESPPKAGELIVIPMNGTAWSTEFKIYAENFMVDSGEIYYEFYYQDQEHGELIPISMKSVRNELTTQFPAGPQENHSRLLIGVKAYNKNGGWTMKTIIITCIPSDAFAPTPLEQQENVTKRIDHENPAEYIKRILLGTLILRNKMDSDGFVLPNGIKCHNNGIFVNDRCFCYRFYTMRVDCSISEEEFVEEMKLAKKLLKDIDYIIAIEPSQIGRAHV